jgi:hypothetical protein
VFTSCSIGLDKEWGSNVSRVGAQSCDSQDEARRGVPAACMRYVSDDDVLFVRNKPKQAFTSVLTTSEVESR